MAKKTVSSILSKAADILEKNGFTTEKCYNPETGGYCALGAIAQAAYGRSVPKKVLDDIAYDLTIGDQHFIGEKTVKVSSLYVAAVQQAARTISRRKTMTFEYTDRPASIVYDYNDGRNRTMKQVVNMLRRAAAQAAA